MRLIAINDETILAVADLLVRIESKALVNQLLERVLLVEAPTEGMPVLPVAEVKTFSQQQDDLVIELFGDAVTNRISVPAFQPSLMVNLMKGFFVDRWTTDNFFIEFVNGYSEPTEVSLDFFLPRLGESEEQMKQMMITVGDSQAEISIHRGFVETYSLNVQQEALSAFSTLPEPINPPDMRSRGSLMAGIRVADGHVTDVFSMNRYFN